ncbi:MAG: hypothetical protein HC888_18030 [Candidatus Competibacteraceae bacterium]|nr:hypothetical protein [Candidatus Competibacteraceae bacterium]
MTSSSQRMYLPPLDLNPAALKIAAVSDALGSAAAAIPARPTNATTPRWNTLMPVTFR